MKAEGMTELTVITLGVDRCNSFMKHVSTIINHKIPIHVFCIILIPEHFFIYHTLLCLKLGKIENNASKVLKLRAFAIDRINELRSKLEILVLG